MGENISQAFQGIWAHKMRSFLTMLGIIIGIASIISIVSTIKGTNDQIKESLIGAGNNVVKVTLKQDSADYEMDYSGLPAGVTAISERTRARLDKLPGVKEVSLYRSRSYSQNVYYQNTAFNGALYGVDSHYFSVNDFEINYGRGFTDFDARTFHKACIVDSDAASTLFNGENPIGKTIEISTDAYVVIGVCSERNQTTPNISSVQDYYNYSSDTSGAIYIPIDDWGIAFRYDEPQNAIVRADSTDLMTKAGKAVADSLTESQISSGSKLKYKAEDLLKKASDMQKLSNTTNRQLIWIAGISLLVGGIGVMNIMLVSVTERTKEIGLKKAIGAKRKRILAQFLTEAAVLTSLGGLIGVAAGIILSQVLANVMGTRSSVSIPACIIAVAFSMGIGIIFGLLPAVKASKLNPIDALRSE
ncbi:ABC transporter permease [Chordicoccus furentiruminis]|jgi:putative ABC transport system permease protein|uniref:ABC transporter permease n=1 Tax=Chordicoccus furentiruminis TaxID=2709410 RepID=UPI0023A83449|nr:ABC transporter permease [Chordicoccus furentiruminis]